MYVCGLVIPVPADAIDAYREWAERSARFFREYGCLEIVESWEDFVPEGKHTDFRKAVAARADEKIVFTWQVWPDKAAFEEAEQRMHADPRMDEGGVPPFDASRLLLGSFQPLTVMGRD